MPAVGISSSHASFTALAVLLTTHGLRGPLNRKDSRVPE